jgi:hypothetical protein
MKHFLASVLLGITALPVAAQTKFNPLLKHELDSLYEVDQRYRAMFFDPKISRNSDSLAAALGVPLEVLNETINQRMRQADASNMVRVQALVTQYGYPGQSLVGVPTNEAVWSIIQHNPKLIPQYLSLLQQAAEKRELPFYRYAMMLDRSLMNAGKEQIYGTQVMAYSGQVPFVWPTQNAGQVNQRRKQVGFTTTIEQNAAQLGTMYRAVTLEEVARMPKY